MILKVLYAGIRGIGDASLRLPYASKLRPSWVVAAGSGYASDKRPTLDTEDITYL